MTKETQWTVSVEKLAGEWHVVLRESGKMDYPIPIQDNQLAWFNALMKLLGDCGVPPSKETT